MGWMSAVRFGARAMCPLSCSPLTPTEFEIMATLMSQPGRLFSRNQLLAAAHGVAFESYERAIDSHIRNLRHKLEPDDLIVTVHGVGYKFEAQNAVVRG